MTRTVHVRRRLQRRQLKVRYLADGGQDPTTLCGAPVTSYDIGWNQRLAAAWTRADGVEFVPCASCAKETPR